MAPKEQPELSKEIQDKIDQLYRESKNLKGAALISYLRQFFDWFMILERLRADTPHIQPVITHYKVDSISL